MITQVKAHIITRFPTRVSKPLLTVCMISRQPAICDPCCLRNVKKLPKSSSPKSKYFSLKKLKHRKPFMLWNTACTDYQGYVPLVLNSSTVSSV